LGLAGARVVALESNESGEPPSTQTEDRERGRAMPTPHLLVLLAVSVGAGPPDTAAESLTLRDGTVLLGQFAEGAPGGPRVRMYVRRAWAEAHAPEKARVWDEAQKRDAPRAVRERVRRLEEWREERPARPGDEIGAWIVDELKRLQAPAEPPVLWALNLDARDVPRLERRSPEVRRMLRQAWLAGFDDPETMPLDRLRDRLEARGIALGPIDPASIDGLLGLPIENDYQWRLRRAATELKLDSGLRFLRYHRLIWPEEEAGGQVDVAGVVGLLDDLFNHEADEDPLASRLRQVAARDRFGALVTALDIAPDFSLVRVEITIWIRVEKARWMTYKTLPVAVRTAAVADDAAAPLAGDPRVQAVFRMVEAMGLGGVPDDVRRSSLRVGAATRQALGLAQLALRQEIEALALPVGRRP
jgi:hypothetical protein